MNVRSTDNIGFFPTFGLKVNFVKSERIFFDNAINATVVRELCNFCSILKVTSITHSHKQIYNQLFKELWILFSYKLQQIVDQFIIQLSKSIFDLIHRIGYIMRFFRSATVLIFLFGFGESSKTRKPFNKKFLGNFCLAGVQKFSS